MYVLSRPLPTRSVSSRDFHCPCRPRTTPAPRTTKKSDVLEGTILTLRTRNEAKSAGEARVQHHGTNHGARVTSNRDGVFRKTHNFASGWAKVRADNESIFVRSTKKEHRGPYSDQVKRDTENSQQTSNDRKVASCPPVGGSQIKDNDRLPYLNRWAEIRKKRKELRKKAARSSKHLHPKNQAEQEPEREGPVVNDMQKVTRLYTNMAVAVNQMRNKPVAKDNTGCDEVVLSRREADTYRKMMHAYDDSSERIKRQSIFLKKLQNIQERTEALERIGAVRKERERQAALQKQEKQLKNAREKYQNSQMHRFSQQYVTSKVLDKEVSDRHIYGLPEEYHERRSPEIKPKRLTIKQPISSEERKKRNMKKFGHLFHVPPIQEHRRPKMEGIDTVVIGEDRASDQKRNVESVIIEAEDFLKQNTALDDELDAVSHDSLDLDEAELFERARRKYNLDLDSDDESLSENRLL